MRPSLIAFLLATLLLAGCSSSPSQTPQSVPQSDDDPASSSAVVQAGAVVEGNLGAIAGRVEDTKRQDLPGVTMSLVSLPYEQRSDEAGQFYFDGLDSGPYVLQARKAGYQPVATRVELQEGATARVTITLAPDENETGPVDFWLGTDRATVVDRAVQDDEGPQQAIWGGCLVGRQARNAGSPAVRFDDAHQLVWPGTASIEITLDWDSSSFDGDQLAVVWRDHPNANYIVGPLFAKGTTFSIPVAEDQADLPRQRYSTWDFALCTQGEGEDMAYGRPLLGPVHVQMDLVRGHMLPAWQAEPDFWNNQTSQVLIDEERTFDAAQDPTLLMAFYNPANPHDGGLVEDDDYYRYRLPDGLLVPPGTQALNVVLDWTSTSPADSTALGFSYASANVPTWQRGDLSLHSVPTASESTRTSRVYHVPLGADDLDGADDAVSGWEFYWSHEGDERTWTAPNACCAMTIHLRIEAVRET